jgi:DNA-binding beta-propeller fold protein YncE
MRTPRLIVLFSLALAASASSASAQVLYSAVGAGAATSQLYQVNPATAAVTPLMNIGFGVTGLAQHPTTGILYGVTVNSPRNLIAINVAALTVSVVGPLGVQAVADISFRSDGTLFGWIEPSVDSLCTINLTTGAATLVASSGLGTFGSGLAFNPSGTLFFAGSGNSGPLRTISPTTGQVLTTGPTLTGSPDPGNSIAALAFNPVTGVLWAVDGLDDSGLAFLVTINTSTGAITNIGSLPNGTDALAWTNVAVPVMPKELFLTLTVVVMSLAFFGLRRRARLA